MLGKYVDLLVSSGKCKREDKAVVINGIATAIEYTLNIFTTCILGLLFHMFFESIAFLISFSLLRLYAGGYHCEKAINCYLLSSGIVVLVLWSIKLISKEHQLLEVIIIIVVISITIILVFAPVESPNKPLDKMERYIYKRRTNVLLFSFIGITLICWLVGYSLISICVATAIAVLAAMLILGKIKNVFCITSKATR